MKILCVIDSLGSGGAQRQLVNLAIGFKGRGHEVSLLVYHSINFFKEVLDEHNITVHEIIEPSYLKRLFKMRRFIRNGDFNSVLSFLEAPGFICEMAGLPWRKWKLVVGERSANPGILKSFKSKTYRRLHFLADYIVANSNENIRLLKLINPYYPNNKFKVIYNIIDFKIWHPAEEKPRDKETFFNLVVAASHHNYKNLDGLIEAVNMLTADEKKILRVHWYGDIWHSDSLNSSKKRILGYNLLNNFTFYPSTNDIDKKIKQSDAVGLFSFYEGLPNVVCEAMAAGKPVIASNVSDIPLLISNKELLFDPASPNEICLCIKRILNMNFYELGQIGQVNYSNAQFFFNSNAIIEEYLKLLA